MKNLKHAFSLILVLFTSQSVQTYAASPPLNNDYYKKAQNNSHLKFDLSKVFNLKAGTASFSIEYSSGENINEIRDYSFFDAEQRPLNLHLNFRF